MRPGRELAADQRLRAGPGRCRDYGPCAPIKVDLSEHRLFGGFDGRGVLGLEHLVGLRIAVDVAGAGVHFGELVELRGFDDDVPAKRIPGIGLDTDAVDGRERDGIVADEVFGLGVLHIAADTRAANDSAEREDGHAAAAKGRRGAARTDFTFGEAEDAGDDERGDEKHPHDRLGDEDEAAGIPARIERKERTHAVVVGPVEQDVAERGDEGGEIDPSPADRLRLCTCGAPGSGRRERCERRRDGARCQRE